MIISASQTSSTLALNLLDCWSLKTLFWWVLHSWRKSWVIFRLNWAMMCRTMPWQSHNRLDSWLYVVRWEINLEESQTHVNVLFSYLVHVISLRFTSVCSQVTILNHWIMNRSVITFRFLIALVDTLVSNVNIFTFLSDLMYIFASSKIFVVSFIQSA